MVPTVVPVLTSWCYRATAVFTVVFCVTGCHPCHSRGHCCGIVVSVVPFGATAVTLVVMWSL